MHLHRKFIEDILQDQIKNVYSVLFNKYKFIESIVYRYSCLWYQRHSIRRPKVVLTTKISCLKSPPPKIKVLYTEGNKIYLGRRSVPIVTKYDHFSCIAEIYIHAYIRCTIYDFFLILYNVIYITEPSYFALTTKLVTIQQTDKQACRSDVLDLMKNGIRMTPFWLPFNRIENIL